MRGSSPQLGNYRTHARPLSGGACAGTVGPHTVRLTLIVLIGTTHTARDVRPATAAAGHRPQVTPSDPCSEQPMDDCRSRIADEHIGVKAASPQKAAVHPAAICRSAGTQPAPPVDALMQRPVRAVPPGDQEQKRAGADTLAVRTSPSRFDWQHNLSSWPASPGNDCLSCDPGSDSGFVGLGSGSGSGSGSGPEPIPAPLPWQRTCPPYPRPYPSQSRSSARSCPVWTSP